MVDKLVDVEQFVGPWRFWSYYGPKQLDRTAQSLHDQHFDFLNKKNCNGDNKQPFSCQNQNPLQTQTHTAKNCRDRCLVWTSFYPFPPLPPSLALKITVLSLFIAKQIPLHFLLPFRSSFLLPLSIILHFLHFAVTVSYHRGAVCDGLASLMWGGRFASVSVVVEVGKEDDEGDSIANQSPLHPEGERAACVEGVASVADGHMELDLLNT